jgi:hypothetical protein
MITVSMLPEGKAPPDQRQLARIHEFRSCPWVGKEMYRFQSFKRRCSSKTFHPKKGRSVIDAHNTEVSGRDGCSCNGARAAEVRWVGKKVRAYNLDQPLLLPPDIRQWLPEQPLALFLLDVVNKLELSETLEVYERGDGRGQPPYHPVMMVTVLLYAYCTGKASSRRIERATYEEVA